MKVRELITELQKQNGESRVFMGYDSNIVVTGPDSVITINADESNARDCWWSAKSGDVVILCDE